MMFDFRNAICAACIIGSVLSLIYAMYVAAFENHNEVRACLVICVVLIFIAAGFA